MTLQSINPDYLYSSEEITDFLHVSLRTTQRLLKSGLLSSFRIHGQYRIKGIDVLNYLDSVKRDTSTFLAEKNTPAGFIELLDVHPITVVLGANFIPLVDHVHGSGLNNLMDNLRKKIILELGFICPGIQFLDDINLGENEYNILIRGVQAERGSIGSDTVKDSLQVLFNHISLTIKKYANEILSREEVFMIIERIRKTHYVVVEEVISDDSSLSGKLSIGELTKILRELLRENVSIRNIPQILEVLADNINLTKNIDELVEKVREGLSRQICATLANKEYIIEVITLSESLEKDLIAVTQDKGKEFFNIDISLSKKIQSNLKELIKEKSRPIICSALIRKNLRMLLERNFPQIAVLSYNGIYRDIKIAIAAELC